MGSEKGVRMAIGWIKLHRQIQDNDMWDSQDEPFDRRSAWIDLLLLANHRDKETVFGNQIITVKAGQRITSLVKLAERWNWSRDKVRRFLDTLESLGMLVRESDNRKTLITIVNYCIYQGNDEDDKTADKTANKTANKATNKTANNTQTRNKESKEIKKYIYGEYKHVRLSAEDLEKLHDEYGEQMTNDCIKYLDEYIEMKGYKAKSHYLCIRKWVVDAVKKDQSKKNQNKKSFTSGSGSESLDDFIKMMEG